MKHSDLLKTLDHRETIFSSCHCYRYTLRRIASPVGEGRCMFIMLNPSTADERRNDPTTRKNLRISSLWGFNEYLAVNLFALISTDPQLLDLDLDPIGPHNNSYICAGVEWVKKSEKNIIVVAWGNHGSLMNRSKEVLELLKGTELYCLGINKNGQPKFPLYVPENTKPSIYSWAE